MYMKITDSYKHPCLDIGILAYTNLFLELADKKYMLFPYYMYVGSTHQQNSDL